MSAGFHAETMSRRESGFVRICSITSDIWSICSPDGGTIDQLAQVLDGLRRDPDSRRHIVSAWNVADIPSMALAPCHAFFQFYVTDGKLSCQLYQRSADLFLGVPFNIASYALLTHMVAQQVDLEVGDFVWTGGDCHIYDNHVEQVREQLTRDPFPAPTLRLNRAPSLFEYTYEDVTIEHYQHHPAIKAPVGLTRAEFGTPAPSSAPPAAELGPDVPKSAPARR